MHMQIPFEHFTKEQKFFTYITVRQQILDKNAIFSDETKNYREPQEPEPFEETKVRIRTAKDNIDQVYLCYDQKKVLIDKEYSDELFDYYIGTITPGNEPIDYYFELRIGQFKCYVNKKGVVREPDPYFHFHIIPGFKTPDWAKGSIMYQIFVDRFYNGDPTNDVLDNEYVYVGKPTRQVKNWKKYPNADGIREFYGGDLKGVMDKLDYLQYLGIEVIYLNPIFVSPSNHKYDTQDYDSVDPHYGKIDVDEGEMLEENKANQFATKYIARTTSKKNLEASNALFAEFVNKAHERGMKVILDGVFNHCGSFNKWLDREKIYDQSDDYEKGAYISKNSPYKNFFYFHNNDAWPDNPNYDGWWGYDTLPKLNYEGSAKLYQFIIDVAKKWVSPPYNADGWRLDVAADLGYTKEFNHQFWRDFRDAVKSVNPNAIILAEHYGDPSDWIQGDQWDTVMNYDAFMEPVSWFLTGMEKHSDEYRPDLLGNCRSFFDAMTYNMARFHTQSLQVAMNELSNHDHSRFLTRTSHKVGRTHTLGPEAADEGINKGIMKEAVVIQMTWPGAPTIYYGDEVGVCGWTDPDNRRSFPWENEDEDLLELHRAMIYLRKKYSCLKNGSIKFLYGEYNLIAYGRWDEKDSFVMIINNSKEEKSVDLSVWEVDVPLNGMMDRIIITDIEGFSTETKTYDVINGKMILTIGPFSSVVLRASNYHKG